MKNEEEGMKRTNYYELIQNLNKQVMKKLNHFSLLMLTVLSTLLFACDDPSDPIVPDLPQENVQVQGTIHAFSPGEVYNHDASITDFRAQGQIEFDGLDSDWIEARHSHVAVIKNDGNVEFQNGEFSFDSSDGSSLYGTYDGTGTNVSNQFEARWKLTIIGGSRRYAGASGHLREIIFLQKGTGEKVYNIKIEGTVNLPGDRQLTDIYY